MKNAAVAIRTYHRSFTQLRRLLLAIIVLIIVAGSGRAQFNTLYSGFGDSPDGNTPFSSPVSDGTFLYGTTAEGTLYKIGLDGTGYVKLLDFFDGGSPYGALLLNGTTLYGMTASGGSNGSGIIFKIKTDGSGYGKLFDFDLTTSGGGPEGSLITDGTSLYGMTYYGGAANVGTVFKVGLDGTGFTVLYSFDGASNGAYASGSLYYDGSFLYGMTSGGYSYYGTAFKIKPDGSSYSKLHDFNSQANGIRPYGSLIEVAGSLYSTTQDGGANNFGMIFKINKDGSGFTDVLDFNNLVPGGASHASLVFDGTWLYGTTTDFGANFEGMVFKVKPDGSNATKLADLNEPSAGPYPEGTLLLVGSTVYGTRSSVFGPAGFLFKVNTDGSAYTRLFNFSKGGTAPGGALFFDGTYFYGTTSAGGAYDQGTIFKILPDGSGYVKLFDFDRVTSGQAPMASLISDGTFLYGTAAYGGPNSAGSVFKIKPDGSGFATVFMFDPTTNGTQPLGSLIYDGTYLYGTTSNGGPSDNGTLFKVKPDGSGFVLLHDFDYTNDGSYPKGSLFSDGTFLYGTTNIGGANSSGTIFKIKPDGSGFAKLYDFDGNNPASGSAAIGSFISDGTSLFGTASGGGANGMGIIFKIQKDGTGFTKLLDFNGQDNGNSPNGSLISDGTFLYGATAAGGFLGTGVIFKIKMDGTGFAKLIDLQNSGGPQGDLILNGGLLYGLTATGGDGGGTMFNCTTTPFTYIAELDPGYGVVGTYVTIYGNNFNTTASANTVTFNNVPTTVLTATSSELTVIVPAGATTGPVKVVAAQAATSNEFDVTTQVIISDSTVVKTCDVEFLPRGGDDDGLVTFVPAIAGNKVRITWTSFDVDDQVNIYDGPTRNSPLLATLHGQTIPPATTATSAGGELTIEYIWTDEGSDWDANITCFSPGGSNIVFDTQPGDVNGCIGKNASFSVSASGAADLTYQWEFSLQSSGSFADLTDGGNYAGTKTATLSVAPLDITAGFYRCQVNGDKASQVTSAIVQLTAAACDLVVYHGISPNDDPLNQKWEITNIDLLPDTKQNRVTIYDRWGDSVFDGVNYDNNNVVFDGRSKEGNKLPSGVYFYKIAFTSGRKSLTGYLDVKQ